jgi:hypothetical protein
MKKCFGCNYRYPLFMFQKDNMKYQRPHDQGRVKVCRICNYRKWSKDKEAWFYNFDIKKFEKVVFKSKLDILKRVFKK